MSAAKAVAAFWQRVNRYDRQNLEAAEIIATDTAQYPGIMQVWARMVLDGRQYELWGRAA